MTKQEHLEYLIDVWENAAIVYANALDEAQRYGDYGGIQHSEHMIQFSRHKVETLEAELRKMRSA
ncbi:hypothetical protein KIH86_24110 [Paenibacillus sp. HN-1]|uniref:hypothetical protein n=1 Tax=Paenibacillus TaxID=44249 RepID=UPI001CA84D9F|nr:MULTISPECIES: hypothetical protein [Paenibacillus]MBY9081235.1 hypothetical protein [Paenibacillus sp. CGMCC 1.18879]MBY9087272.1 hypothetical protein [Paenibacillus sinensis]